MPNTVSTFIITNIDFIRGSIFFHFNLIKIEKTKYYFSSFVYSHFKGRGYDIKLNVYNRFIKIKITGNRMRINGITIRGMVGGGHFNLKSIVLKPIPCHCQVSRFNRWTLKVRIRFLLNEYAGTLLGYIVTSVHWPLKGFGS